MNAQAKKLPLVLAAFSLCTLFACSLDSRDEKKEKDLELQRWIYLALTTSRDVTGSCIAAETQGIACASAAGQTVTYGITISSVYGTSSSSANAATLCNDIPNSALYTSPSANFSATAKICHFGCYRSYFQNQITQNRCASQFTSIMTTYTNCLPLAWLVTCTDTTLYNCLNSCFRTGTVLP